MKFEWDENKNKNNYEKHKVSFEQAISVFYDEAAIVFQDVVHLKDEDILRIISARKSTDKERRLFYE